MGELFSMGPPEPVEPEQQDTEAAWSRPSERRDVPLAVRMRPRTLDEVVGQDHLLGPGSPLRRLAEGAQGPAGPSSVVLWGPPGTGKTTLAHLLSDSAGRAFVELSAVTAGVRDVRKVMDDARAARDRSGRQTVLFLDEIHRFTKAQQDALLPGVENRWVILVAATTENPSFSVVAPLLSRSLLLTLRPLEPDDVRVLLERSVDDEHGLGGAVRVEPEAMEHLVRLSGGDARRGMTALEAAAGAALAEAAGAGEPGGAAEAAENGGIPTVTVAHAERALDQAAVRYDRAGDQHYDVISAFIKSVRGSDADAALHYLARMIEAGEDPRFIARRLVILASEDIGLADPSALGVAVAAAQAVQLIGLPEGRLSLAQATLHLALAPKSNSVITGIDAAIADLRAGRGGMVPPHLRDAHYPGAARHGHGTSYRYPHADPLGVLPQQYPPDDLLDVRYYTPSQHGAERDVAERWPRLRGIIRGE